MAEGLGVTVDLSPPRLSPVEELEKEAERRYVRWDPVLWREILEGPAAVLATSLEGQGSAKDGERLLLNYLRLAREAVGLGYLVPEASGATGFFNSAWFDLLPRLLPALAPADQPTALAQCWNLAENLQRSPPWLRRLMTRSLGRLDSLKGLEEAVGKIEREVNEPPSQAFDTSASGRLRSLWRDLGEEDRRFLPGRVHLLAPRVACVHDRQRTAADGRSAITQGVWLSDPVVLLGPMGCKEDSGVREKASEALINALRPLDPRFTEPFAAAANPWAVIVTLETSQAVVVLLPA